MRLGSDLAARAQAARARANCVSGHIASSRSECGNHADAGQDGRPGIDCRQVCRPISNTAELDRQGFDPVEMRFADQRLPCLLHGRPGGGYNPGNHSLGAV